MLAILPADPAAVGAAGAAAAYLAADSRVRRSLGSGGARGASARRLLAFLAGLVVIVVALTGPIDAAASRSFADHMVQHLLLMMVAAPLLLLGAPLTLALRAWAGPTRRRLLAVLHSAPIRLVSNPLVAWPLFFVVIWGSHLTGVYEAALRDEGVHALEHVAYLASALLFWMPVVRADPTPSVLSYPARILYLFLAMPAMAFLGLVLVSARYVLYPAYAQAEGIARALADQRAAGAIMWGGTMVLIVPALGFVLLDWMRADEREARRADERLAQVRAP
jgi:putative membrane protein